MSLHYYLTIFPMEAMIASQLEPEQFASYMAVGSKKGSAEQLMFLEVEGGFKGPFDWKDAEANCIAHADGRPKNSYYLSIYRVLENTPLSALKELYLVTKDGRSLKLNKTDYKADSNWHGYALYKELCPVTPLVASIQKPDEFGKGLTNPKNRTNVPTLIFSDIRVIKNLDDLEDSGDIGNVYDRHPEHLKECIKGLQSGKGKTHKIVDRTYSSRFAYQLVDQGFYVCKGSEILFFPMPNRDELKKKAYDWGQSAYIF